MNAQPIGSRTSANACASRRFARRRFALPVVTRRGICELPKPTEVAFTVQWLVLDGRALWLARPPANHRLSPTESRWPWSQREFCNTFPQKADRWQRSLQLRFLRECVAKLSLRPWPP